MGVLELKRKKEPNTLVNLENYGPYAAIATEDTFTIKVSDIIKENWRLHYESILNIMKDGIYTERVQSYFITVDFGDIQVELSIVDYWFNLIVWSMLIYTDIPVRPKHIMWSEEFKAKMIENYVNNFFIFPNRSKIGNRQINNIIADMLECSHQVDNFAPYLANTLNLEDTAELMMQDEEFYRALHDDYSNLPADAVKEVGMKNAVSSIERIKKAKPILGRDHCLADAWRAGEGINTNQYREFTNNLGNKPDGRGGIFPKTINRSFINGGVSDPVDYFIESSTGRIAQIIKYKNVSTSGTFARILGLNNMDSYLYPDTTYDCHTRHLLHIFVRSDEFLKRLNLMYYRLYPNGREMRINYPEDKHLVGQYIYLRSPITCASAAKGHGVCWRCYGDLAYSVFDIEEGIGINIGRIATETTTAKLTQKQLSVKHLLEAKLDKIEWSEGFYSYFNISTNVVQLSEDIANYKNYRLLIDPESIELEYEDVAEVSEDDDISIASAFNEYITEFYVQDVKTGEVIKIHNNRDEHLFITEELNALIRKKAEPADDEMISISFSDIKDIPLFVMILQNNEITKTLNRLTRLFNKYDNVKGKTLDELFQEILDVNIDGGMGISAIHYAILLMNQVRSADDEFSNPDWNYDNVNYQILTLNEALNYNPSITISLSYQKVTKMFYSPLTYRKHGASFMDLFFMKRPQRVIRDIDDEPVKVTHKPGEIWEPIKFTDDPDKITVEDTESSEEDFEVSDD